MRRIGFALLATIAVIGSAAAADMPVKAPVYKAPVVAPPYNWTGFYIGGNVGYSWGKQDLSAGGVPIGSPNINGVIGGGQIGYNWQINQLVLGIEADIQASGQKGDGTFVPGPAALALPTITYDDKLDWFGTVRGRAGYAIVDRWLAYATGGWAFGGGSISGSTTIPSTFSGSASYSGWTVGGGLEWAFMDHWSAKAEYLYIDFGNGPTIGTISGGKMTDNIARVGVNYHF